MKKGFFVIMLACFGNAVIAQSIDDIKKYVILNKFDDAKKMVDGHLADAKNAAKADGWYYKGVVYNELSKKDVACSTCKWDAFEAFKKYQTLDPKNALMELEQNVRLFDIYNSFFEAGAKAYNTKDYDKAYTNFKNADEIGVYINGKKFSYNGFSIGAIDTSLVQNVGASARLANKNELAVPYYEKLASLNLNAPENIDTYQFLLEQYEIAKNTVAFNAMLAKGKKLYPDNEYWIQKDLEAIDKNDKKALFAKYEELLSTNPKNFALSYNYAVELFNYTFLTDPKPADYNDLKTKSKNAISNAIQNNSTPEANLLMARALYNDSYDLQDELNKIKGVKPDDLKRKNEKKALVQKASDDCIKYCDAAIAGYSSLAVAGTIKSGQKAGYKSCYTLLEGIYDFRENKAKADEARKKGEALK